MKLDRLRGKICEKRKTHAQCAAAIGRTPQTFSAKINGRIPFDIVELNDLANFLDMTNDERSDFFLH